MSVAEGNTMRPVILLTDFGQIDDFAGVCHGVILARAPGVQVVHLTHGITPQFVLQGALVLRNTLSYMPVGVHMAIVDPGVGTARRAVAVDCADGRSFVGPDNGLLSLAIAEAGGATQAVVIDAPGIALEPVSDTFHARDVFAPAAGHLAAGGALAELGTSFDHESLQQVRIPAPELTRHGMVGTVWNIDRFGNVALHVSERALTELVGKSDTAEIVVRNDRFFASLVRTFGNVRSGDLLLYTDSYGSVSIAVNKGNAAEMFRLRVGNGVEIRPVQGAPAAASARVHPMSPRSR